MRKLGFLVSMLIVWLCSSCSNNDYLNAIPAESKMLISMDPAAMSGVGSKTLLKAMLHVSNLNKSGIDVASKVYLFVDGQGNLGFCAKMSSSDKLTQLLKDNHLQVQTKRGYNFSLLPNNWLMGYSDVAVLLMGPILPSAQAEMASQMAKYLNAEEEDGVLASPLYAKLDSIDAPMAMVTQAQALPEQFVAPFTMGAPKDASPSDVYIAAKLKPEKGVLWMEGQTFSFKKKIDQALEDASKVYRPIQGKYVQSMPDSSAMGLFVNVDGKQFIKLMRQNRGIQAMLAGINAAIDMDNIIKSINGDMAIITPSLAEGNFQLSMAAQLKNLDWLADVDYWKQSVPEGGRIADWGRDCYYYKGGNTTYYFGVTSDMQYMSGGSKEAALQSVKPSANPLRSTIANAIKGKKLVMVINMKAFGGDKASAITSMLRPLFGDVNTIVYILK
jgi:hypothetical protein